MKRSISALLLSLGLAVASPTAQAQPASVFLEDLTWTELRDQMKAGRTAIILPVGGTEQNGPHIALGKHNVRVKVLAGKIAEGLGNAMVAPVLSYVPEGTITPPTGHMRFPGTITVPEDVFEKVLESAAQGFRLHGFREIILLGDHGSYQKSLRAVAERLNREWARTSARVHAITEFYDAATTEFSTVLRNRGHSEKAIGQHAGLADTSLMLAIDPAMVRGDRLDSIAPWGRRNGVEGDPRHATAELGNLGVELIVDRTVEAIRARSKRR